MKVSIASDHAGYRLKDRIAALVRDLGHEVIDLGVFSDASTDYPDHAAAASAEISAGRSQRAILICGTGVGMSIAANKVPGIRAALVTDIFMARMAKEHNNANILVLGGRVLDEQQACAMVSAWLDASFEGGRHQGRLNQITEIERKFCK